MTTAAPLQLATRLTSQRVLPTPGLPRPFEAFGHDRYGVAVAFGKGSEIFAEGDAAENYYKVASGAIRLYKLLPDGRRHVVDFFMTGDSFGFTTRPIFDFAAESMTDTTVIRYPRRMIERGIDTDPAVGRRLLASLCTGLAAAQDQMLLLGRKSAVERVASFLLVMAERVGRHEGRTMVVDLFMTRADIADHLGLTTETVSRTFTELRSRGLIALEGAAKAVLLQPQALEAMSAGGNVHQV